MSTKITILKKLKEIEEKEKVKILYAVESGSRAWGFESKDSDYDVRLIYIRPLDWYLSIDDKKDFIEYPVSSLLDISGWDIKKVIRLFKRSNPPLYEWLNSPIVYLERGNFAQRLRDLMPKLPQTKVRHLVKVVERLGLTFQRSKRKPRSLRTSRRKTNNNLNSS